MRSILVTLVLVLGFFQAHAQEEPTSFSLQEAIDYALKYNYSILNADRDLLDAQKQKWEVIASGLPQISAAVSYQNQLKQPVNQIPAEFFGGEPGTFAEVVFGQPQSVTAFATLTQQIFDGSYIVGVQATQTFLRYSENNKKKTDQEVLQSVVEAYGNVLLAQESVLIFRKNLATLEKNLYETKRIFENGLGDQESVDQLQITFTSVENQLKNAERLEKITLQMLNVLLGREVGSELVLTDKLNELTQSQINYNLLESDLVLENNIDYQIVENLNDQRRLELKLAKSRALPTLNAFVNYGFSGFGEQFNFLQREQDWFASSVLGIDLRVPIFSSLGRSASTQRAKIAYEKAKTQKKETEQLIWLQHETAKSNYILAIEEYNTSKKNLELAERIEGQNQVKYSEGVASSFELRQAQTQLYSAQQEYLQNMVRVINSKTELQNILNK
ncbi:TolC family protein [Aureicoccus marinus]|uniref:Transporter n=1 Tax=Aureicoccus marinus TaxID=754435 RepID=A0A2S7T836_9FLAO|nr:TolC family protein [Aureicoccus marinus]PQJ16092.1 transporter [Aureicoccus marinus]